MKIQINVMSQETGISQEKIRVALGIPETFNEAKILTDHQKFSDTKVQLNSFRELIAKCSSFLEAIEAYKEIDNYRSLLRRERDKERIIKKAIRNIDLFGPTYLANTTSLEDVILIIKKCPYFSRTKKLALAKERRLVEELAKSIETISEAKSLFDRTYQKQHYPYQKWLSLAKTIDELLGMYRIVKHSAPNKVDSMIMDKLTRMITSKIDKARTIKAVREAIKDTDFPCGWSRHDYGLKKWNQLTISAANKAKTVKQAVKVFKESAYQQACGQDTVIGYETAEKRIGELFSSQVIKVKSLAKIRRIFVQAKKLPCLHKYSPELTVVKRWLALAKTKDHLKEIYEVLANDDYYGNFLDQVIIRLAEFYKR